ncbi:hypothetical protein Tco_0586601 [Tanacetum coccineum]
MEGHVISIVGDEAIHKELGDKIERVATTTSCLEAEHDSDAQTRFETTSKQSNDPPLSRVNTLGSGEDNMKLMELMAHFTKLSELGTATARTTDDGEVEITASIDGQVKTITEESLRRHLKLEDTDVKKLEKKVKTNKARRTTRIVISEDEDAKEDSSKQGRKISKIDKDPTISIVPVTTASATPKVSTTAANLVYIRRSAEKRKDKGKAFMKEDESVQKKLKK